jgi:DNA end-binding protein Ku
MATAMRSMYKGALQFGLVTVPIRLYLATDPPASGAHLLHADCLGRIAQRTWCPSCNRKLARAELVRGFEVSPGRHVAVTDEEYASLPVRTLHTIEIVQFVATAEAVRLGSWARQPYYLAPEALGRRAFALLCAALEDAGLAAVAKLTIRDREHLATVRPLDDGLLLTTLAWPAEIRSVGELDLPSHADLPEAELRLARDLVLAMERPFEPAAFRDEYADALGRLVEAKAAGGAFSSPAVAPTPVLVDLMAALRASLAAATADREAPAARRRRAGTRRSGKAVMPANAA